MSKKSFFILLTGLVLFSCQPETQPQEPCNGGYNISYTFTGDGYYNLGRTGCVCFKYYNGSFILYPAPAITIYLNFQGPLNEGIYTIGPASEDAYTATAGVVYSTYFGWPQDETFPADSGQVNITSSHLYGISGSFYFYTSIHEITNGQMNEIPVKLD